MSKSPCAIERINNSLKIVLDNIEEAESAGKYLQGLSHIQAAHEALTYAKHQVFTYQLDKHFKKKVKIVSRRLAAASKEY